MFHASCSLFVDYWRKNCSNRWRWLPPLVLFCLLNYVVLYFVSGRDSPHQIRLSSRFLNSTRSPAPPRNAEWEQLNRNDFFRRSCAFLFARRRLVRVYFLSKAGDNTTHYAIRLVVEYARVHYALHFANVSALRHDNRGPYDLASLNLHVDLIEEMTNSYGLIGGEQQQQQQLLSLARLDSVSLFVLDTSRNLSTRHPIRVKLKQLRDNDTMLSSQRRGGAMVCTYCYFYGRSDTPHNYLMLLYWLELNKHIGYARIAICNHSLPNTRQYAELFERHKKLVVVYQMKSVPNLMRRSNKQQQQQQQPFDEDTEHEYLSSFNDMPSYLTVPLEVLMYNECYMDHADDFAHISINGADELILPRNLAATGTSTDKLIADIDLSQVNDKASLGKILGMV